MNSLCFHFLHHDQKRRCVDLVEGLIEHGGKVFLRQGLHECQNRILFHVPALMSIINHVGEAAAHFQAVQYCFDSYEGCFGLGDDGLIRRRQIAQVENSCPNGLLNKLI